MASLPLPNLTGGAATATAGESSGRADVRTTFGPVVVGGFKSDGSATTLSSGALLAVGAVILGVSLWYLLRRK